MPVDIPYVFVGEFYIYTCMKQCRMLSRVLKEEAFGALARRGHKTPFDGTIFAYISTTYAFR